MKQKDILLIVVIAIVAGVFSFVVANFFFGGEKAYQLKAAKVEPITQDFTLPNKTVFNPSALNPTKNITIGDSSNTTPFKTAPQQ
jgi:hypothetical protein